MIKILVDFGKEVTCIITSRGHLHHSLCSKAFVSSTRGLWGHSWGHMTSFVMNFVHHNAFVRLQLKAALDPEKFYSSAFVTQSSLSTSKMGNLYLMI